jgi:hypothetical protein
MRLKPPEDLEDWVAAVDRAAPDLHIDPTSPVDSYSLMEKADVVFTYGSTTGVEAAFFGCPVVVMGPSAYDKLGCARRICRDEEIGEALDAPPVPNPSATIPYGLVMQRRGFAFDHVRGRGEEASLAGVDLAEASDLALKVSHALHQRRTARLMRR